MRRYIFKRLLQMIPTFLGITLLTFAVSHLAPGDPLQLDPENANAVAAGNAARANAGLDEPLPLQYARWLGRVLSFDFGRSLVDHQPISGKLGEALPRTLLLAVLALLLAYGRIGSLAG